MAPQFPSLACKGQECELEVTQRSLLESSSVFCIFVCLVYRLRSITEPSSFVMKASGACLCGREARQLESVV